MAAIRATLPPAIPVSATIGDLPAVPATVAAAVRAMAASGCDLIKIGLFPGGESLATIEALGGLRLANVRLAGLLLADHTPDFTLIAAMARAGFAGIMLDTAAKDGSTLTDHLPPTALAQFIGSAHEGGLFAGLAGSLRLSHVPHLVELMPDVLGFRGALCEGGVRTGALSQSRVAGVRAAIEAAAMPSRARPPDDRRRTAHEYS